MENNSRRRFIANGAAVITGMSLGFHEVHAVPRELLIPVNVTEEVKRPVHVFTKVLQFLSYEEMAEMLAELGFAGADMTVRPGGQVLPENVGTDLPKAVRALRNAGITANMITTGITDAADKLTRAILKTMADQGIEYYRLGWLNYNNSISMADNQENFMRIFEQLEKVNREFGVHGGYQNHSGQALGAPVWDLYQLLKDRDPVFLGVQYDIRHATVEGANSWPLGMKLIAPWIKTIDIKDFAWDKDEKGRWNAKSVPLGKGMVDFDAFFRLCSSLQIEGPISVHYEYDLGGAEHGQSDPKIPAQDIARWLKKDLDFLKAYLG